MQPDPSSGRRAIFVLGLQRSGTTWVANMLHGSGAVAAVAAEDHRGVHESIFFSHFAQLSGERFRRAFAASDYWLLGGLSERDLDAYIARNPEPAAVFEAMMDALADASGTPFWLEKSPHHTVMADYLAARFPAARFVCVVRNSPSLIASRLSAYGRTPSRGVKRIADILRGTLANAYHTRLLERFSKNNPRAHVVRYDAFAADPVAGRAALVQALGLPVSPEKLVSQYAPNSSHDRGSVTKRLSAGDRVAIAAAEALGKALPLRVLARIEAKRRRTRGPDWPDWVWRRSGYQPTADEP